ncbi:hypothetical protein Xbed_03740 [Xenorhabdus beddingii]|uniref:Uncharacterized protein n=1 Tax=Xenorhabdus beddingii TaxID=40578 RepID=A0A1Y2S7F8_9GAMM|nr:hypothetical protein Xbed_03740 [Xenorhabdus beddingii]
MRNANNGVTTNEFIGFYRAICHVNNLDLIELKKVAEATCYDVQRNSNRITYRFS